MRYFAIGLVVLLACTAVAQQPDAQQIVNKEFGKSFTVVAGFTPLVADIDNDGTEDMIIVVTSKTPLVDETDFHYRAIDPYDGYWGYGNAHDTIRFASTEVGPPRFLAILHDWHAPKEKFLVVNLPFEKLTMSRVQYKKKAHASIHSAENDGLESDLFWDGKKYRWEPAYFSNE